MNESTSLITSTPRRSEARLAPPRGRRLCPPWAECWARRPPGPSHRPQPPGSGVPGVRATGKADPEPNICSCITPPPMVLHPAHASPTPQNIQPTLSDSYRSPITRPSFLSTNRPPSSNSISAELSCILASWSLQQRDEKSPLPGIDRGRCRNLPVTSARALVSTPVEAPDQAPRRQHFKLPDPKPLSSPGADGGRRRFRHAQWALGVLGQAVGIPHGPGHGQEKEASHRVHKRFSLWTQGGEWCVIRVQ